MKWFILITWRHQPVTQRLTTCNQASPGTVPVAVWTRTFNLTGRERVAAGRFLARVDANRTLAPSTLESGSRPEQVWTRPKTAWGKPALSAIPPWNQLCVDASLINLLHNHIIFSAWKKMAWSGSQPRMIDGTLTTMIIVTSLASLATLSADEARL